MPRDINVIEKEHDALFENVKVWGQLIHSQNRTQRREYPLTPLPQEEIRITDKVYDLYMDLIENAYTILQALRDEKEEAEAGEKEEAEVGEKEEHTAINVDPVIEGDEMVGGKRQKTRKNKKSRKSKTKKTRRKSTRRR